MHAAFPIVCIQGPGIFTYFLAGEESSPSIVAPLWFWTDFPVELLRHVLLSVPKNWVSSILCCVGK